MPFVPPKPLNKQNQGTAPVDNQNYRGWPLAKITFGISKKKQDDLNTNAISHSEKKSEPKFISKNKSGDLDRDSAIQQVKDILSTSPQISSSPRRRSAPESYTKKPTLSSLKVDLLTPISSEIPYLPRKKSGEVVKSSLKKGKSEPTTPTFPKYVHFNTDLEQIKLFRGAQKPRAVSAEVSSDESDDEDFDLSISKPVFVDAIYLSPDKRKLKGRIQVQNIAFQKSVEVRYTFDFWQSVSEVSASYAEGVPDKDKDNKNSFDLFVFAIDLIDNSRNQIDGKTMYFAVHYKVDDRDYWDNNSGSNYQVNFRRKEISSSQLVSSDKYNKSKSPPSTSSKWSTPTNRARNFEESPPVRSPPIMNSSSTSLAIKKSMGGRYDIGLSLIAAQSVSSIRPNPINTNHTFQQQSYYCNESFSAFFPGNCIDGMPVTKGPTDRASWEKNSPNGIGLGFEKLNTASNPIAIPSARPAIGSSSYCELVKQYCFYSGSPP
ncbi:512_t:CDS:2, partial [Dentiscutata heterogama]